MTYRVTNLTNTVVHAGRLSIPAGESRTVPELTYSVIEAHGRGVLQVDPPPADVSAPYRLILDPAGLPVRMTDETPPRAVGVETLSVQLQPGVRTLLAQQDLRRRSLRFGLLGGAASIVYLGGALDTTTPLWIGPSNISHLEIVGAGAAWYGTLDSAASVPTIVLVQTIALI